MQLFRILEPVNGPQTPGLEVQMDPEPQVKLGTTPSGEDFVIPLGKKMSESARLSHEIEPSNRLLAADLIPNRDKTGQVFIQEMYWNVPAMRKARWAFVHIEAGRREGDTLLLTGPKGLPELVKTPSRVEVQRPYLPFAENVGVYLLSDDFCEIGEDGAVRWKDGSESAFVTVAMCKGASFRVVRTNFRDAPQDFTLTWDGKSLNANVLRRGGE